MMGVIIIWTETNELSLVQIMYNVIYIGIFRFTKYGVRYYIYYKYIDI